MSSFKLSFPTWEWSALLYYYRLHRKHSDYFDDVFCKIDGVYLWGRKGMGKNIKEFTRKLKVPDFHSLLQCLLKIFILSNLWIKYKYYYRIPWDRELHHTISVHAYLLFNSFSSCANFVNNSKKIKLTTWLIRQTSEQQDIKFCSLNIKVTALKPQLYLKGKGNARKGSFNSQFFFCYSAPWSKRCLKCLFS